jgi:hypothetical protein
MSYRDVVNSIAYLPVTSDYYWQTNLNGVTVDGDEMPLSVDQVIFDTGSSYNVLPYADYLVLLGAIKRNNRCFFGANQLFTCRCNPYRVAQ